MAGGRGRELLLDLGGLACLALGLVLPWDAAHLGLGVGWVRTGAATTLAALLLPRLVRWGGVDLPWAAVPVVKALLALPMLVLLTGRAVGALDPGDPGDAAAAGGLYGHPSWLAWVALLAAVVAAVLPRRDERLPAAARRWWWVFVPLAFAMAVLDPVTALVLQVTGSSDPLTQGFGGEPALAVVTGYAVLAHSVPFALLLTMTLRRRPGWSAGYAVLGAAVLLAAGLVVVVPGDSRPSDPLDVLAVVLAGTALLAARWCAHRPVLATPRDDLARPLLAVVAIAAGLRLLLVVATLLGAAPTLPPLGALLQVVVPPLLVVAATLWWWPAPRARVRRTAAAGATGLLALTAVADQVGSFVRFGTHASGLYYPAVALADSVLLPLVVVTLLVGPGRGPGPASLRRSGPRPG